MCCVSVCGQKRNGTQAVPYVMISFVERWLAAAVYIWSFGTDKRLLLEEKLSPQVTDEVFFFVIESAPSTACAVPPHRGRLTVQRFMLVTRA